MSPPSVILYRYDASPYSHKMDNVLLLKNIPHRKVNVAAKLPRPEITDMLGIVYRRIPILAIGNDVYCDTNLIVPALERRFPASSGYGTVFPLAKHGRGADTGLIKAFSKFYVDAVFSASTGVLPWEKLSPAFLKDRGELAGAPINLDAKIASRGIDLTRLSSHLALVEEQLSDGREWLFDTELPNLADISIHFVLAWIKGFPTTEDLFIEKEFPHTLQWLEHMSKFLAKRRSTYPAPVKIMGAEAADMIISSSYEHYDIVGFDSTEASRLALSRGDTIQVISEDNGRNYPTVGKLVAINREEVVIEVQAATGILRCHFPRLGFSIKRVPYSKL